MQKIVWNGVDNYVELEDASALGYRVENNKLLTLRETFSVFEVCPCAIEEIPVDVDGELVFEGFYLTENGKVYKDAY